MGWTKPALLALMLLLLATTACKRSAHARVSSYTAPPMPAGFAERSDKGWRMAVPSTWNDQKTSEGFTATDPQTVDDFSANVSLVTESFAGDSYDYAKASETGLRGESRVKVENVREDVIDGDPTLVIESRWTPAPPATVTYLTMQSVLSSRGTGYVVTCAVASSAYERYRSTCDSVLHSFAVQR